jgi:hypothetical protein
MVIEIIYLFSGLVFMGICWMVARWAVSRPIRFLETNRRFVQTYLFSPASFVEAACGVVGSTISFYITVFTSFCLSFGWGSILIFVLMTCVPISFGCFYVLVVRVVHQRFAKPEAMTLRAANDAVTFMDYLQLRHLSSFGAAFCASLMLLYIVSTVSTEMDSMQILYDHIIRSPADIIQQTRIPENYKFGFVILLCSIGYVLRGGYPGIMKIDVLQVALIALVALVALVWIFLYLNPIQVVLSQFIFANHEKDIIIVGVASAFLVVTWISAALDNWLRVCGSMVDRVKELNRTKSPVAVERVAISSLRKLVVVAALLATLISVVPAFLGLELRRQAIEVWETHTIDACANAQQHKAPVSQPGWDPRRHNPQNFLEEYLSGTYLLVPTVCGDWMAPNTGDPRQLKYFGKFTSSIYDFFALVLAEQWVKFVEDGTTWTRISWILFSAVLAVSIICAVITTVNSYLLCTSQLVYRFVTFKFGEENAFLHRVVANGAPWMTRVRLKLVNWLVLPLGSTLLVSLPIAYLVQSGTLDEANYISYGILAFCNIVYLAMVAALSIFGKDSARVRRCIRLLFVSWIILLVLWYIHLLAESGKIPTDWETHPLNNLLASRSIVVLAAVVANLAVWAGCYVVEPAVIWLWRAVARRDQQ